MTDTNQSADYITFYTVAEIAAKLRVTESTVRGYIRKGLLDASKLPDGKYRIREGDINQVLTENPSV